MNQNHEPICPSCKANADFRISNLPADTVKKKDGDYKREIRNALVCNQCGAVICQINLNDVREDII
jgi:ribosomal protein L37AE/L43A